jgi:hypothetical protein
MKIPSYEAGEDASYSADSLPGTSLDAMDDFLEIFPQTDEFTIEDSLATIEVPEPEPKKSVIDENFVNWVTHRMRNSKVEVPFQLPTEVNSEEETAPTERVRVRYRVEP